MKQNNRKWSEGLKQQTREIIDNQGMDFFCPDFKLHMKNLDSRYGYITIENLLQGVIKVVDNKTGVERLFDSGDELIDSGWVID